MDRFYGFQFKDGRNTTTGEPHPLTRRMSIAGELHSFESKNIRDKWVSESTKRVKTNKQKAKSEYFSGLSQYDYDDYLKCYVNLEI